MIGIQEEQYLVFLPMEGNLNSTIEITLKITWNSFKSLIIDFKFHPKQTALYRNTINRNIFFIEMQINHQGFPARTDLDSFLEIRELIKNTIDETILSIYDIKLKYYNDMVVYIFTLDKWNDQITCGQFITLSQKIRPVLIKKLNLDSIVGNILSIFIIWVFLIFTIIGACFLIKYYNRRKRYYF
ncbi:hypothetical protein MXB_3529, partial [Myxobolus squamalis]